MPPSSSKPRRIASEYFAIWRRFPSRTGWQRAATAPIGPAPTTTSAPTLSASKPRLAIVYRRRPVSSSSRRWRWRYPSSSTRPSRAVSTSTSRSSQRPMRAVSSATAASRAAETAPSPAAGRSSSHCSPRTEGGVGDVADAEDRRCPQPEHVLHARVCGHGVDVGAQPLEHVPASLVRSYTSASRYSRPVTGSSSNRLASGLLARLRVVLDMNWFDRAIRSWSTRCAFDRNVTLGMPAAELVARTHGSGTGEAPLEDVEH